MECLKIVIAGSRSISEMKYLIDGISKAVEMGIIKPAIRYEIISGGAIGVDTLARDFAQQYGYTLKEYKPDYGQYGKYAPLRRNTEMAIYGDVLIAIWDGRSTGTQHMVSEMRKLNKPVYIHKI